MATIYGTSANDDPLSGTDVAETIHGLGGDDNLPAGAGNDNLYGGDGNDTLVGQQGNDVLLGGAGNDYYFLYGYDAGDKLYETISTTSTIDAGGTDTVISYISWTLGSYFENLLLDDVGGNINGTGNALDNQIVGNTGDNILSGNAGNDQLSGGDGNDTLIGGTGFDYLSGGKGDDVYYIDQAGELDYITEDTGDNDTLKITYSTSLSSGPTIALTGALAGIEHITLTGTGKFNLTGNDAANVLTGNGSVNVMTGGDGDDVYVVSAGDLIIELDGEGDDTIKSSINWSLAELGNVENLILTGMGTINGTGNALDNTLIGNSAANMLTGGAGDDDIDGGGGTDTMKGGAGNDFYHVDKSTDAVVELAGEGDFDTVYASVSYSLAGAGKDEVENLWLEGISSINATGNGLDNDLQGNAGNNILDGGVGADTMYGGAGNDTFIVDNIGDVVQELFADGPGIDLVKSSVTYTLAGNIENLTLTGTGNINGTGNELANILIGNSGINNLAGGGGNDTYYIGAGDTVVENINAGADTVYAGFTYSLGANVENLTLTGTANINGSGNNLANVLKGNSGKNVLTGYAGDDIYVVNLGDTVVEEAGAGWDKIESSVSWSLAALANVEDLTLTGTSAISATGNALNNTLDGSTNSAANRLAGGLGDDTYVVGKYDIVVEKAGEGSDEVESSISWALSANIESLELTGTKDISGTGNAIGNLIIGNSGNNKLDGGAGADTMYGGAGDDTYYVDDASDGAYENGDEGTDIVYASATYTLSENVENLTLTRTAAIDGTGNGGANIIIGNVAANTLNGEGGNDMLKGGAGNDTLMGGMGNDTLDGGTGVDFFYGGSGDDVYLLDQAAEEAKIYENAGEGNDTVIIAYSNLSVTPVLWDIQVSFLENITITGTGRFNLTGNGSANVLTGNGSANVMTGGGGNDIYVVSTGDTVIENVGEGTDTIRSSVSWSLAALGNVENLELTGTGNISGTGNDLSNDIAGNSGNNSLIGGGGNDYLFGGAGNDTLDGGTGDDYMIGGKGNDVYVFDSLFDNLEELANEGTDTVRTSINWSLAGFNFANVENLTLTGAGDVSATGNALNNVLTGNAGNNVLNGGLGNDTMWGGSGDDFYYVDSVLDKVYEIKSASNAADAGGTADEVFSTVHWTLGNYVENLTLLSGAGNLEGKGNGLANVIAGNDGNNLLLGEGGNDRLYGYDGHDRLDGGAGNDTMEGGAGDDIYFVNAAGDTITEALDRGTDTVYASISYALTENVENLTLTGTASINATGNSLDNVITGNSAANRLTGGAGNDTYVWSSGDTLVEAVGGGEDVILSGISLSLASFSNIENLTLTGAGNVNATGDANNNKLTGNAGNNRLDGGAGADTLTGGQGNDTYVVTAGDTVVESADEGTDTVESAIAWTLAANVENLTLKGSDAINGTGNVLANIIRGDGNSAANALSGGAGDDTYYIGTGDTVVENSGEGTDTVYAGFSYTLAANVENLTLTGASAINATGNALNNTLTGNSGNNVLTGGAGNDAYHITSGDTVVENSGEGTDTVYAGFSYTLAANVENLTLTGASAINATGNALNNTLIGNVAANRLAGGAGDDTYYIGTGDTVVEKDGEGNYDKVYAGISYTLPVNVEWLELTGTANINATGNAGNNHIWANAGRNVLTGGAGSDTYHNVGADDTVVENAGGGTDAIETAISWTLGANIEILSLTGSGNVNGTGNDLDNYLYGNTGGNRLDGGLGNDTMAGYGGDDTYVVNAAGDSVEEGVGEGTDTVESSISWTLGANFENLTLTGSATISGTGNIQANIIRGDTNSAANALAGGAGDDTYYLGLGDTVTENGGEGTDTVYAGFTYTLGVNVENLMLTGFDDVDGTGNALDNVLMGNGGYNMLFGGAGNDTLQGGDGNDTLLGGTGNDTYVRDGFDLIIENPGEGIDTIVSSANLALSGFLNIENLTLTGSALSAYGNALDNVITGNSGNNILDGGTGNDTLLGGTGNDTYYIDSGDTVVENVGEGLDTVYAGFSYTLAVNVENLVLTGTGNINGTGNSGNNVITGNIGNNLLIDGTGADSLYGEDGGDWLSASFDGAIDTLLGGSGDDVYYVDELIDQVIEGAFAGNDTVVTSMLSYYTLGNNVENLTHSGVAKNFTGIGNGLNNTMYGNSNASHEVFYGYGGNDTLIGRGGNDLLSGDEGNDDLRGDEGNDDLYGGTGNDTLTGGFGADKFYFNMPLDGATNVDTIQDFAVGVDKIYLDHSIFTSLPGGVLSSTYFMEDLAPWGDQDYIMYDQLTGRLWYDGDGTGSDFDQILFATLIGTPALQASDIVVY